MKNEIIQNKRTTGIFAKIIYAIITIIYLCIFSIVIINYFNENRYWEIDSELTSMTIEKGQPLSVNTVIKNKMYYVISSDDNYFISYHMNRENGVTYIFENPRTTIDAIDPGHEREVSLRINAPLEAGKYEIEIDIVKEGEYWFKERGERPGVIYLTVL